MVSYEIAHDGLAVLPIPEVGDQFDVGVWVEVFRVSVVSFVGPTPERI